MLVFGRQVFSLGRRQLLYVAGVSALRLIAWTALTLWVWRLALPEVAMAQWTVLLAIRCLVSRIPLISNKDLVFGNLMLLLLGAHSDVAVLLATLAFITLGLHLAVTIGLAVGDLARGRLWSGS
ncbi:MAG: hypothetical protein DI526_09405 [Caulobacter segnis]|uniref:Uncharacterized protein n=1 Tax=Caulobacter segnis TaxID=88688 RepID=A0A2W5XBS3_9CAUL|nr:MAG: hypothetical protein DI526_09405 [Caulobacter segnis]